MKKAKILIKSPFYGAGTTYNWTKDGYHIWGIGLNTEYLWNDIIEIEVRGNTYTVSSKKIKDFVKKYNSLYTAKNNTTLAVFSYSILRPKNPIRISDFRKASEKRTQLSLF